MEVKYSMQVSENWKNEIKFSGEITTVNTPAPVHVCLVNTCAQVFALALVSEIGVFGVASRVMSKMTKTKTIKLEPTTAKVSDSRSASLENAVVTKIKNSNHFTWRNETRLGTQ